MVKNAFKIEILFAIICLFWGLFLIFISPPLTAPDENAHLYKMWGYTTGSFNFKKENNWAGQILPLSLIELQQKYETKQGFTSFDEAKNYIKEGFKIKLEKNKTQFFKFVPSSYSPISYFPSFVVLFFLKFFNVCPLAIVYILRFCSLVVYLALLYNTIKITPSYKWVFFLLGLLPTNLYIATSVNTDALVLGLCYLTIAYTIYLGFDLNVQTITKKQLLTFFFLIAILGLCKFAYLPFILLYFIIPKSKFKSRKNYWLNFVIISAICSFIVLLFLAYISYAFQDVEISGLYQKPNNKIYIQYVLTHPLGYLSAVIYTVRISFFNMASLLISSFGTEFFSLPIVKTFSYWAILFLALFYKSPKEPFNFKNKFIMATCITVIFLITITAVFILYQNYPYIRGVQGRYLTPLIPLMLFLFSNKYINIQNKSVPYIITVTSSYILLCSCMAIAFWFYFLKI